jgi:hypothetical protein
MKTSSVLIQTVLIFAVLSATGCGDTAAEFDADIQDGSVLTDTAGGDTIHLDSIHPDLMSDSLIDAPTDNSVNTDTPNDSNTTVDSTNDASDTTGIPDYLPTSLGFEYTREDVGTILTPEEIAAFTRKVMRFLRDVHYFDYVLYTTHGVDASTGKRDWQFWYNERFRKEGNIVTFYHPENLNDGGHNLHIPMSKILGDVIAAYLVSGDASAALASEKLCKGMSASMLGMAHDENDPLPFLMSRNIAAFSQEFDTHDGKRKAVDFSGWYSPYERWNCNRYQITQNPYWGELWVTNLRSKDDVPYIFRLIPNLRYVVADAPEGPVKAACTETLTLLESFAKDLVDQDYRIRTKDADGVPYSPGYTGIPELDDNQGDISSFTYWRDLIPESECNARRSAALIAYHAGQDEECGRGEPNAYDDISFASNGYNKKICQFFHLSHLANAIVNHDRKGAALLMDGLNERIEEDKALGPEQDKYTLEDWNRGLSVYLAQASNFGYPLTSEEVRSIHKFYGRAVDRYAEWPYWDPWDVSVPDGELGGYRPGSCQGAGETLECWWNVEDMAQIYEHCWSPVVNPTGAKWVDCDIVRDPMKWDETL